jgi:hypothetical protein
LGLKNSIFHYCGKGTVWDSLGHYFIWRRRQRVVADGPFKPIFGPGFFAPFFFMPFRIRSAIRLRSEMKARLSDWNANRHNFLIDRDRSISCDSDPTWRFEPAAATDAGRSTSD